MRMCFILFFMEGRQMGQKVLGNGVLADFNGVLNGGNLKLK